MGKRPAGPTICPDCKSIVGAGHERCPMCGRACDWFRQRPSDWWMKAGWPIVLAIAGVVLIWLALPSSPEVPRLQAGRTATTATAVWLATDEAAFDAMVDGQNAGTNALLGELIQEQRAFREPAGSQVLVKQLATGSAFVRVVKGANVGATGWVQSEMLNPEIKDPRRR